MSISTHILDTAAGRPAANVAVELDCNVDGEWEAVNATTTDADGRVRDLLPEGTDLLPGVYCIRFATGAYFEREQLAGLYPLVEITFTVRAGEPHYHVPLLISANGFSTYRGS